jgi:hypothetical protein
VDCYEPWVTPNACGAYKLDCSGFGSYLFQYAVAPLQARRGSSNFPVTVAEQSKWNGNQWLRKIAVVVGKTRPTAGEYTDYFLSTNVPNNLWTRITDVGSIVPGDIISWKYANPEEHNNASGHFVFAYGYPDLNSVPDRALQTVFDSSSGRHETDTRTQLCDDTNTCGLGVGTIAFSYNTGGEITGVYWKSTNTETVTVVTSFAIARPQALPYSSCYTASSTWTNIVCDPFPCSGPVGHIVTTLNTIGGKVTPWTSTKTAYQNPGSSSASSCTCALPPGCTPSPACSDTAYSNCPWPGFCGNVYIFSSALYARFMLRYGLGRYMTWPTTSTKWWDNWLEFGIENISPLTEDFHNYFSSLSYTTAFYFMKIDFDDLKAGDIISFSSPDIFSGAHVMFALGPRILLTGETNLYSVMVMDSIKTHDLHCQDSRRYCENSNCGVGWGKVHFETDASDNVIKFYWSGPWVNMPYTSIAFTRVIAPNPAHGAGN